MADSPTAALPGIAALPPTTARQIGSGQVLVDPNSLVKELIDNSLDARAKSVFVDISSNTIDTIQVKDDGHGIPAEDRALVCRRYCTSKIRDFHDLKEVGGTWLGFRGEALSSAAEISGTLAITTRVEGEPVAVKLKYGRNGELITTDRESHPVGTTVKAVHLFEHIPVRKQTATKNSAKSMAKIRRLMRAYALARPAVRFRLHVLKAPNNKADFIYAPKASSNIEDAVIKVIGKDCALQCDWTAIEDDGFEIHAFLPKPTATGAKVANQGPFISVDARPVSCGRGTMKQIVSIFKEKLRETGMSLSNVKDPFFCMNMICPPGSYDANIEPAKDDVMFDDGSTVLRAVRKLFEAYYPKAMIQDEDDAPTSAQQPPEYEDEGASGSHPPENVTHVGSEGAAIEELLSASPSRQPQWRSSMYGIDEDDLVHLNEDQTPVVEEEVGRRAADVSNPWTIALMNTTVKSNKTTANGQLLSPAKSFIEAQVRSSSPAAQVTPRHAPQANVLTPQTSPGLNAHADLRANRDEHDTQQRHEGNPFMTMPVDDENSPPSGISIENAMTRETNPTLPESRKRAPHAVSQPPYVSPRKQKPQTRDPAAASPEGPDDTWFGQPMRGSQALQPSRKQQHGKKRQPHLGYNDASTRKFAPSTEPLVETILYSENNSDIREYFGHGHTAASRGQGARKQQRPSSQPSDTANKYAQVSGPHQSQTSRDHPRAPSLARPYSMDSDYRSLPTDKSAETRMHSGKEHRKDVGQSNRDMAAYFKAYQDPEEAFVDQSASPARRHELRAPSAHEHASYSRPQRRRTTDGLHRTRSSKLPLERVLKGHHLQNIILYFDTSIVAILQNASHLTMRENSLAWPYPATDNDYDAFIEPTTASKVMEWVVRLDAKLGEHLEPLPGADARSLIHEAIQRGLDERQDKSTTKTTSATESSDPVVDLTEEKGASSKATRSVPYSSLSDKAKAEDETSEFDISQFMDLQMALSDDIQPGSKDVQEDIAEGDHEFEDAIDDEMLLDL